MNDSTFVDTAPYVGIKYCGISWESAFLTTQYYLYLYYNDTDLVRELYELDKKWMEKVARLHPEGMVRSGLSDHESLEPVPVELTGTAHYLQCAEIMSLFARLMGDSQHEQKYQEVAHDLREQLKTEFWDKPVKEKINRQTLFSTLLYHDIVPEEERQVAVDALMKAVANGPSGHFNTGIFGTKYVLEVLSAGASPELVYGIVNSTNYPGWGHMIDQGATTIWETWKESDNVYSNCHPMFGTVTEWYYRWLAGIRPLQESPGFKEFVIAPSVPAGLAYVNCHYDAPQGRIVSNWKIEQGGACQYEFEIPKESIARLKLDINPLDKIEIQKDGKPVDQAKIDGLETGKFRLPSGHYFLKISRE